MGFPLLCCTVSINVVCVQNCQGQQSGEIKSGRLEVSLEEFQPYKQHKTWSFLCLCGEYIQCQPVFKTVAAMKKRWCLVEGTHKGDVLNSWLLRISGKGVCVTKECAKVKGYVASVNKVSLWRFAMSSIHYEENLGNLGNEERKYSPSQYGKATLYQHSAEHSLPFLRHTHKLALRNHSD